MGGMDPKDGMPLYTQLEDARHLAQRHQWEQSQRLLHEILDTLPGHVLARNVLALTLVRQGRFDEAAKEYRRSLEYDPKQNRVLAVLGSLELKAGHLDQAVVLLKASLEITPGFVEAICNLGFVQALRGDEAGAREWYAKAVATDPSFPRTHTLIADLYFDRGEWKKALAEYENALKIVADDFQALIQAGNCARRLRDPAGAARFYGKAEKLRPDSWIPVSTWRASKRSGAGAPKPWLSCARPPTAGSTLGRCRPGRRSPAPAKFARVPRDPEEDPRRRLTLAESALRPGIARPALKVESPPESRKETPWFSQLRLCCRAWRRLRPRRSLPSPRRSSSRIGTGCWPGFPPGRLRSLTPRRRAAEHRAIRTGRIPTSGT